jgi:hypothetical protein
MTLLWTHSQGKLSYVQQLDDTDEGLAATESV